MKTYVFLWLCLCMAPLWSYGQEICNDGFDNDLDGFIDCYDNQCSANSVCDGTFTGNDANCQAQPIEFPQFTMQLEFSSPDETTNHLARMAIGDLDRDGVPEIITMNRYTDKLFILDGRTGAIKNSYDAPFDPQWEIAIANIDNDNCAEIFTFGQDDGDFFLYSYNCDFSVQNWSAEIDGDPINFGLADFNQDGKVELYAKDEIFDAHTGTRLVRSQNWNDMNGGPVAVDILGTAPLELVAGGIIYGVNLGDGTADNGSLTELMRIPDYYIRYPYNATSVADFNKDGRLDVLASGSTVAKNENTTIFFWDVFNNVVKTYFDNTAGAYLPDGWQYGTGRINIADLDGDGALNASYVSGKFLYALKADLTLLWRKVINEETSGHTGCTLFDFNADGKSEIVYRDERFLYIINGTDGSVYNQQNCVSRTNREYPIVADVDADGSTEMCVTCGFDDDESWDNFNDLTYSRYSHVRVFKSAAEPWVPARRLWNQHGYFVVNVNDDLTIPRVQQKHHLVWSTGTCSAGPTRPLNGFLNQSPYLNSAGCITYASPDILPVPGSLVINPPTCPSQDFTISFVIANQGDVPLDGTIPISFYDGNPLLAGATLLETVDVVLNDLQPGDQFAVSTMSISGPGGPFNLHISMNDNGTPNPTPIVLPNTNFVECDYVNNIMAFPITPFPVALQAVKVSDNFQCVGSTTPPNGAVRAFVDDGTENTTDYDFFWFDGTVVDATPDNLGAAYNGIANGIYTVFAVHKTAGCASDTTTVTVGIVSGPLIVEIEELAPVTDCKDPNGSLMAVANPDAVPPPPPSDFDFAWYQGNDIFTSPQIGVSDIATDLKGVTYSVLVTEKFTGCQTVASYTVPNETEQPVVTPTSVDVLCSTAASGEAHATVPDGPSGFLFEWSDGTAVKPVPDFIGPDYTSLTGGSYTVAVTDIATNCTSDPVTVAVVQTSPTVVTAAKIADQTSCDPARPNGTANALATGGTAGYTYDWFIGQNTEPINSVGTGSTISTLGVGLFTVLATDNATGCVDTDEVTIEFAVALPTLSPTVQPVTTCTPFNGTITAMPSIDTPADYTFSWYNGPVVKTTTDFPDTDNLLATLPPGEYTVQAVHNTKFCEASPITVTVVDNSPVITMTLNLSISQFPSDCRTSDGVMVVDIATPSNNSGLGTAGFAAEWFGGRPPFPAPSFLTETGIFTTTASNLKTGVYSIIATDLISGCTRTQDFDLPFASAHELEIVSKDDVEQCVPGNDGSAVVRLVLPSPNPIPLVEDQFDIFVYKGSNDPGPGGTPYEIIPTVLGQFDYPTTIGQFTGPYTYVAVSNNTDPASFECRSVPKLVQILRLAIDPVVSMTSSTPNTNCTGATGNGQITTSADGASPLGYTFEWFQGSTSSGTSLPGSGVNGEQLINATAGSYMVRVTNNDPVFSTGCIGTRVLQIANNPMIVSIAPAGITPVDLENCALGTGAVLNDGSATITAVTENGGAGNLANYTFQWTNSAGTVLPGATPTLTGLGVGTYFVKVSNTTSLCFANLEFEINDNTIQSTIVGLASFETAERCIAPRNGRLTVNFTGNSTSGYSFEWFNGALPGGPIEGTTDDLQNITIPAGQTTVTKTVKVINNTNNCWAVETYELPLIVNPVTATASSSPLTNCLTNDGSVFGTVTNDNGNDYRYEWSIGTTPKAVPDFTGSLVPGLAAGDYTLVAIDLLDAVCKSAPQTTNIADMRVNPVVAAVQTAPNTNCDPLKLNGGAAATANGNAVEFTFNWFTGSTTTGTSFFTGSEAGSLGPGPYAVLATHRISGCFGVGQVTVEEELTPVPNPTIVVESNVTSCLISNGMLSASVNGETSDYIFSWYTGTTVSPPVDYTGEVVDSLAVGSYTVVATSKITGCTSGPDTGELIEDVTFPEFEFIIVPASCDNNNGYASLVMASNVPIESIVWDANGSTVEGPNLADIPSGTYTVTVTSQEGCATTKDVTIGTEIRPFNGVSRNGDGRNEYFNISCIDNFPFNNVKIFNRAGTMVYEGDSYDNAEIYFDGRSNRGVSPMGINLPDGTYYYVIDKRDGSKPIAGYLELVK